MGGLRVALQAIVALVLGTAIASTLGPLTAAGIAGVASEDAGAASGLVIVARQLGGSLGLGILVTVFGTADHGLARGVSV